MNRARADIARRDRRFVKYRRMLLRCAQRRDRAASIAPRVTMLPVVRDLKSSPRIFHPARGHRH
jgi:hypothetical protein